MYQYLGNFPSTPLILNHLSGPQCTIVQKFKTKLGHHYNVSEITNGISNKGIQGPVTHEQINDIVVTVNRNKQTTLVMFLQSLSNLFGLLPPNNLHSTFKRVFYFSFSP